jgi:hypothetical protein
MRERMRRCRIRKRVIRAGETAVLFAAIFNDVEAAIPVVLQVAKDGRQGGFGAKRSSF